MTNPYRDEPFIFAEEETVLGILEEAGVSSEINDKVIEAIRPALERSAITDQIEKFMWELARRGNANTQALTRGISRQAGEFAVALAALRKEGGKCRT